MLTTAVAIVSAIALLSPGFLIIELSQARGARSTRSDLELALRAISYAVVVHLLAGYWTYWLAGEVGDASHWRDHAVSIGLWAVCVLLIVPVAIGIGLSFVIEKAEAKSGPVGRVAAALGAGAARDAFDYAVQRRPNGAWVVVELVGHTKDAPKLVGGVLGSDSASGQTPSAHDVYFQQLMIAEENGDGVRTVVGKVEPASGVYIPASQIARIDFIPEGP